MFFLIKKVSHLKTHLLYILLTNIGKDLLILFMEKFMESLFIRLSNVITTLQKIESYPEFSEWADEWLENPTTIEIASKCLILAVNLYKAALESKTEINSFQMALAEKSTAVSLATLYTTVIVVAEHHKDEQFLNLDRQLKTLEDRMKMRESLFSELDTLVSMHKDIIH